MAGRTAWGRIGIAKNWRGSSFAVVISLAFLSLSAPALAAAPGELDSSFGSAGVVTKSNGAEADVVVQPDGKLVTVGSEGGCTEVGGVSTCHSEFLIERYNADGTLDSSFGGGDGRATASFGSENQGASSVLVEPGGKLLVGGTTYDEATGDRELALARFNADGSLDTSFGGGDGRVTFAVTNPETLEMWPGSMVLQPSGKIVLGGEIEIVEELSHEFNEWVHHPVLARFNADGSVDTSFGSGGGAIGPRISLFGLAEEPGGKLLGAGQSGANFAVTRFNADGSTDTSFAGDGIASVPLSPVGSQADDVMVQPDGKIVASGYGFGYAIARFNSDGTPDPTFGGGDGVVMTFFDQPCCGLASAISEALQSDGSIVFAGQWTPDEDTYNDEWGIGRLYPNGLPDKSFGDGGLVTENFGGASYGNDASRLAIQPDGKIIAVGNTGAPNNDFGMLRLIGGGSSVPPSTHHLLIAKSGSGEGGVYGSELLNCGANCGVDYPVGEAVSVSAFPEDGSTFTGWTTTGGDPGTCTGLTATCEVTLDGDVELVAQFSEGALTERHLIVDKSGTGAGTVTSSPAGILCGSTCSAAFDEGTEIALTATPSPGSVFTGWSGGGCSGAAACGVSLTSDVAVTATFAATDGGGGTGGGGGGSTGTGTGTPATHPQPPATPSPPPKQPGPPQEASGGGVAVVRGSTALVKLQCPGTVACQGVAKLLAEVNQPHEAQAESQRASTRGQTVVIGKSRFSITPGHHITLRIRLNSRGKQLVRRAGKRGVKALLTGRGVTPRPLRLKPLPRATRRG